MPTTGLTGTSFFDVASGFPATNPQSFRACVAEIDEQQLWYAEAAGEPLAFVPLSARVPVPAPGLFTKVAMATL